MRALRRIVRDLNILLDDVELCSLLMHHMGDITEQLIQLTHGLLDVPDFRFALDDQGFLEVDVVLIGDAELFLLLLLVLLLRPELAFAG